MAKVARAGGKLCLRARLNPAVLAAELTSLHFEAQLSAAWLLLRARTLEEAT
jgi:hypothetical protein